MLLLIGKHVIWKAESEERIKEIKGVEKKMGGREYNYAVNIVSADHNDCWKKDLKLK